MEFTDENNISIEILLFFWESVPDEYQMNIWFKVWWRGCLKRVQALTFAIRFGGVALTRI